MDLDPYPAPGPDPDPALSSVAFKMPNKKHFSEFFLLFLHLHKNFKDNKSFRRHKTVDIKFS